jgi:rhodanese-related sulfurtransferase
MKRILMSLAVSAALLPAAAFACEDHLKASVPVKKVTVAQLAKDKSSKIFDANSNEFRAKNGTIPGAILLTSSSSYDVAKELPADKNASLVFYCAGARCSSSDMAAHRAAEAGYTNVAVLPEGLTGWKAAGQKTAPVKPNS